MQQCNRQIKNLETQREVECDDECEKKDERSLRCQTDGIEVEKNCHVMVEKEENGKTNKTSASMFAYARRTPIFLRLE